VTKKFEIPQEVLERLTSLNLLPPGTAGRLDGANWILAKGKWARVSGTDHEYVVTDKNRVITVQGTCSCDDFNKVQSQAGRACKHLLAMLMVEHNETNGISAPAQAAHVTTSKVGKAIEKALQQRADQVVALVSQGHMPLLWGATGAGKTSAVHIALLKMSNGSQWGLEEAVGSESWTDADIIGTWTAERTWAWGPIGRAFQRAKAGEKIIIFIDEITRFSPRAMDILMRTVQPLKAEIALAKGIKVDAGVSMVYCLESPMLGFQEWCPADNIVWIAAGNPWMNPLDPALVRRFLPVEFTLDPQVAKALDDKDLGKLVIAMWKMYEEGECPIPLEYQALMQATSVANMLEQYLARIKVLDPVGSRALRDLINNTGGWLK
jgi:predicted nucleic acid-binding Zn finger protein